MRLQFAAAHLEQDWSNRCWKYSPNGQLRDAKSQVQATWSNSSIKEAPFQYRGF